MADEGTATNDLTLAHDAVVWGFPLVMMGRYLDVAEAGAVRFNTVYMSTEVATPKSHAIGPNIDTLNGRFWLDLDDGPVVLTTPDTEDRYYCIQMQDMYMNSFGFIGRRTTGTAAGAFAATPPGWRGTLPEGVEAIEAPTSRVMALARMLVRGPGDLAAALALNAAMTAGPLAAYPGAQREAVVGPGVLDAFQPDTRRRTGRLPHEDMARSGGAFFEALDRLVRRFPPPPEDAPMLARFARLGVGGVRTVDDAVLAQAAVAGVATAQSALETTSDNGWMRRPNVEAFIRDPVQRAANNVFGPNTQVAEESVFFNKRQGPGGQPLSGAHRYRLRFAPGGTPPVDAFWSLTLYDADYVLFDNPLDRYGVTDHGEDLRTRADGSLEIRIQADPPEEDDVEWLPAPRGGFQLVLRTYQPREPLLTRAYKPPPLERVEDERAGPSS